MPTSAPSAFALASFSSLDEITVTWQPASLAKASANSATPPVPCTSTREPGPRSS